MRVDEHTIELAGSPVFLRRAPAGEPTPLYLHGVPTSSDDWGPFLERTGGVAPDLPGFGRSAKGGHLDYSLPGLTAFLEQLLDELQLHRLALIGHSWGATAALALALRRPSQVERIVLIDPVTPAPGSGWPRMVRIWRRPLLGELAMGATTRRLLTRQLRRAGPWEEGELRRVWEQFDQGTQRAILRLHRDTTEPTLAELWRSLPRLEQPALVIWGGHDPWLPAAAGEKLVAQLRSARLELIPGAGHWPWRSHPEIVERVAGFLA